MKFEDVSEVAQGVGQIIATLFGTNILMFVIGVIGWPFIVTFGAIAGAICLLGAAVVGLCSLVASFFN